MSTVQIIQILGNNRLEICADLLLTKYAGRGIMEISALRERKQAARAQFNCTQFNRVKEKARVTNPEPLRGKNEY